MTPTGPLVDAAPAEALGAWRTALRAADALRETTIERRDLRTAHGHVLARDVYALQPSPPFRCAAMDGYGVHAAATTAASPEAPVLLGDGAYEPIDTGQYLPETWDAPDPQPLADAGDMCIEALGWSIVGIVVWDARYLYQRHDALP